MAAVHNGVGSQRRLVTAIGTLIATIAIQCVAVPVAAHRVDKTLGPLNCIQIFHTVFLIGESLDELTETQGFFRHIGHLPLMPLYILQSNNCHRLLYLVLCLVKVITTTFFRINSR